MRFRHLVVFAFIFFAASAGLAQQGTSEIRGKVADADGTPLPGVTVHVRNQETGMYRQTITDSSGTYFISGVTPGTYELTAELAGFSTYKRRDVRLEIGKTATVDIPLTVGVVGQEITVTAEAPIVDVTSKEIGGNITSEELVSLPTVNRNFVGFVGLLPGVVPNISTESFGSDSVSVNGQDDRNNNYMLDGSNNNDDVIGQRAGTQARTPLEAIQEFQVLTGQFDAEFGRSAGAIINAISKQGSNEFKGSAFATLQDAEFTEESFFVRQNNLEKPDTRFFQYGGTIGGPIVRDRAHFFVSVERVENDRGNDINIPARPDLNTATTTEDRVWNTLVRGDHQINEANTWNVRWLREHSPQANQIVPSGGLPVTLAASREEDDLDQTVVGTWSSVLRENQLNTLRLGWTQEDVAFANPGFNSNGRRQDLLPPTLRFRTYVDQQSDVAQARINNAYQIEDTFSWFRNRHDVRFGFQYQYSTNDFASQDNFNGSFTFATDTPFNPADPRTYPERLSIRVPGPLAYFMRAQYIGLFVQDKWEVVDRLTLSAGLRYDQERIPIKERDNPAFSDPDDYPVDEDNIAPRVGFAYELGDNRTTVIRGGAGRFFDKTHFELITAIITGGVFSNSFTALFPANAADPGPSQGRLPSHPLLVNGPVVNRQLLAEMFPPGSRIRNTGAVSLDNPDREVPYADQISIGFERALFSNMSLGVDYIHAEGKDQFMTMDLNPGVRRDTTRTGPVDRINPAFTREVLTRINVGETTYDAIQLQLEKRLSNNYQYRLSYTYSESRGNTPGTGAPDINTQFLQDLNLDQYDGPTNLDRPHNAVFAGSAIVPYTGGLHFATVVRYMSGTPFTIHDTNFDPDRNGILFDPLPAGRYSGTGQNAITVDNDGGRNGARGPDFFQADVRLGYILKPLGRQVEIYGELFNVTDRANFDNPTGDRRSTNFLRLIALRPGGIPRTGQFGVRFEF